jgi:hypothetical protein
MTGPTARELVDLNVLPSPDSRLGAAQNRSELVRSTNGCSS